MENSSQRSNRAIDLVAFPAYVDYGDKDAEWVEAEARKIRSGAKKAAGGRKVSFPFTLHTMLDEVDNTEHDAIVSWLPHGRAFKVHNPKAFETEVLPLHFKFQSTYQSFQRQLNSYSFRRLVGLHSDQNAYYHECFLRGRTELCALMSRSSLSKKSSVRCTYDSRSEPNFYRMKTIPRRDTKGPTKAAQDTAGSWPTTSSIGSSTLAPVQLDPQPGINPEHGASRLPRVHPPHIPSTAYAILAPNHSQPIQPGSDPSANKSEMVSSRFGEKSQILHERSMLSSQTNHPDAFSLETLARIRPDPLVPLQHFEATVPSAARPDRSATFVASAREPSASVTSTTRSPLQGPLQRAPSSYLPSDPMLDATIGSRLARQVLAPTSLLPLLPPTHRGPTVEAARQAPPLPHLASTALMYGSSLSNSEPWSERRHETVSTHPMQETTPSNTDPSHSNAATRSHHSTVTASTILSPAMISNLEERMPHNASAASCTMPRSNHPVVDRPAGAAAESSRFNAPKRQANNLVDQDLFDDLSLPSDDKSLALSCGSTSSLHGT